MYKGEVNGFVEQHGCRWNSKHGFGSLKIRIWLNGIRKDYNIQGMVLNPISKVSGIKHTVIGSCHS